MLLIALAVGMGIILESNLFEETETWMLKAGILAFLGVAVLMQLMLRYRRATLYAPYILAFMISQTGFAYAFQPGYYTSANEILTLLLLIFWTMRHFGSPQSGHQRPYYAKTVRIFLFIALAGIFTAYFWFEVKPLNTFIEFKSYALYLSYLFMIPDFVATEEELQRLLLFTIVVSLVSLFHALLASSVIQSTAERLTVSSWGPLNIFVGYVLPLLFVCGSFIIRKGSNVRRLLLILYGMAILYALLMAQTRSGWIVLLVCSGLFGFFAKRKRGFLLLLVAALVALVVSIAPLETKVEHIIERRIEATVVPDTSLQERYGRWEGAWAIARSYPLTGSGWGGVLPIYSDNSLGSVSLPFLPLWHNAYLEILSQTGLPGLITFLFLWMTILRKEGLYLLRHPGQETVMHIGLLISVVACLIYALAEQQFYRIETASHTYLLAGLLIANGNIMRNRIRSPEFQQFADKDAGRIQVL